MLGGKAIVCEGDQYFVLMTLDEFGKIKQQPVSGLTKQELVDKINDEINLWKQVQEEKQMAEVDLSEVGEARLMDDEIHYENPTGQM